ncbi:MULTISPECIES: class 1 fructose-bisphosphatase [unclassified Pseudoalteromonas]|uniref:class 1 fructose-bisphosphatase n=1 Tax=unclassified Pseudoalteromonas TaxID=194690 RepID=UPI001108F103|nr:MULTISPECIES: class 1 fructose-bisphosphatase [unclassified Pseudoalteromonas]TMN85626.1 class 1 fructose-bisphosphatase [Pseudoalteromonas sp. S410]TMN87986.1 class 1 fructose-bisphosphatase [Pseudoalteromonas sp. S408]TMN94737.1 class 1 fructose-bisphosphatase [Pseudoalteromonas sp. S407]TMN99174.1 class 1 fructose-bisphosphatase [Pseudoalteromonas sp. S409]TMO07035.1 class 1 fructose-bisphosphatase [Pseudoalteromonas sp. S186]|tara:strand:+ start:1540 stop:2505 length:966 start_codon:yes stop_codon:yes gene_type:complete
MKRLNTVLKEDGVRTDLILLIRTILATSKEVAFRVGQGELAGVLGSTMNENIQGEVQKKLDIIANQLLKDILLEDSSVRTVASEEEDHAVGGHPDGAFIVAFDPLDGSSNIDVNGQIGTIFTIYLARDDVPFDSDEQFNQPGVSQVCAGYVLYGPSSLLVMTTGGPTRCYTLDSTHGGYLLTNQQLHIPSQSREFAVNMANYRYWDEPTQVYFDKLLYTSESFEKSSIRWNAAMVGDVHRILCRGGLFLYPQDKRVGNDNGKIRLLYEANPLAMLVENAGGKATSRGARILEIAPDDLHQRVPVTLGSTEPVDYFNKSALN